LAREGHASDIVGVMNGVVAISAKGKPVKCKTVGQKDYVSAIKANTVTFGVGPAGTGKTYLAVCLAVAAYKGKQVEKIILTRPAVEAGEKLGFLPGDLQTKVDPYLRPLYDALQEMFGVETYGKLMEKGVIEVAPLAYMRGRTLSNAFVILDEAQNATREQMKMFLTRLGDGSKMVVTGDLTQTDLPEGKTSGLKQAVTILKGVEDIAVCTLTDKDVVRHPLVMRIVRAYEKDAFKRSKGEKS
jgi:phosphate starvation-inducible PhoH-like protein